MITKPLFFKTNNEFLSYLNNNMNYYDESIIDRFKNLPDKIINVDGDFLLEVILTPLFRDTKIRYEINYFNEKTLEYLFPYINDTDISVSLALLEKNLKEYVL